MGMDRFSILVQKIDARRLVFFSRSMQEGERQHVEWLRLPACGCVLILLLAWPFSLSLTQFFTLLSCPV